MSVLVCGSRDWDDQQVIDYVLDGIHYLEDCANDKLVVIEGGAKGADACAKRWIDGFGGEYPQPHEQYPADWKAHGKAAGPIRNQQMMDEGQPDVVWAFKDRFQWGPAGHGGTEDMVRRAKAAGIPTYVVSRA